MANTFDCLNKQARRHDPCEDKLEKGKIRNVAFIRKSQYDTYDFSDPSAFLTALKAAELTGDAIILRNIDGDWDGGTDEVQPGRGGQIERFVGSEHNLTLMDFEIMVNVPFWNTFRRLSRSFVLVMFSETKMWISDPKASLSITGKVPSGTDPKLDIVGEFTAKWYDKGTPEPLDFGLSEQLEEYQALTGGAVTSSGAGTLVGEELSILPSSGVELTVDFTDAYTYRLKANAPSWLTIDSISGVITGTSPATATSVIFTVEAESEHGILGTIDIKIIVS